MTILNPLLLVLLLAPAARALDWTGDPVTQVRTRMTRLSSVVPPLGVPVKSVEPVRVETPLECRPEIITAFKEAWALAGFGREEYEAAFRIDRAENGYAIEFMPMTHEPYTLPVRYYPSKTAAIVHTHPDTAERTPGPGDYASKVPNFVVSRNALFVTIPGTKRHRLVRRNWDEPC